MLERKSKTESARDHCASASARDGVLPFPARSSAVIGVLSRPVSLAGGTLPDPHCAWFISGLGAAHDPAYTTVCQLIAWHIHTAETCRCDASAGVAFSG